MAVTSGAVVTSSSDVTDARKARTKDFSGKFTYFKGRKIDLMKEIEARARELHISDIA